MRQLKISKSITNRDSVSLEKYLSEIGKVDLITAEEEVLLTRRIKKGDTTALEKLCTANLRFVVSVAKQYQNQGLPLADLINEGNLGLLKAAERFDETRGFKFISYAVWWIRQQIMQSLAEQSRIVRLPLNKVGAISKVNKAFAELEQEFEREPTPEELSNLLQVELEEVRQLMGMSGRHVSVDAPLRAEEESSFLEIMIDSNSPQADIDVAYHESLKKEIERTLNKLPLQQCKVLKMYFGIGMEVPLALDDIGAKYGISKERVRQIRDAAIKKLKATDKTARLKEFLGS